MEDKGPDVEGLGFRRLSQRYVWTLFWDPYTCFLVLRILGDPYFARHSHINQGTALATIP